MTPGPTADSHSHLRRSGGGSSNGDLPIGSAQICTTRKNLSLLLAPACLPPHPRGCGSAMGRRSVLDAAVSTIISVRRHPRSQHRQAAAGCVTRSTSANTNSDQDKGTSRAAVASYFSHAGGGARPWLVSPSAPHHAPPRAHSYGTTTPPDGGGEGGGGSGGSSALRDPSAMGRREEEPFEKLGTASRAKTPRAGAYTRPLLN